MATILYTAVAPTVVPNSWKSSNPEVIAYVFSVALASALNIHLFFRTYQLKDLVAREWRKNDISSDRARGNCVHLQTHATCYAFCKSSYTYTTRIQIPLIQRTLSRR